MAREAAGTGIKELVLTGVNLGEYGGDNDQDILELFKALDEIEGIQRIRISSIEPNLLSDAIIEVVAASRCFLPHFHIPLQSGSDRILSTMRRRYRRSLYEERVKVVKSRLPHAGIGADVIVGFPGETDEDFTDSYNFIKDLPLSYLHVFTYSERQATEAENLSGEVQPALRKERNRRLTILGQKLWQAFAEDQLGQVRPVLIEQRRGARAVGLTDNYLRVKIPGLGDEYINTIQRIKLAGIEDGVLAGELAS
jgi:threonylcarbamoyladenosine tRNA methylthiotransferase MtaB